MAELLFIAQLTVMTPPGFRNAVRDAAREEGLTTSEFIRQAIRVKLNGADIQPVQVADAD